MDDQLLVTVREAARRIGFGRSFTYDLIRRGELKSLKIGAARRVLVSDIHDFVRKLKEASDADE